MPENDIHPQLRKNFRQANKELWRQTASKEIENKDPFEILAWQNSDNISFSPYYESADNDQLTFLNNFQDIVAENGYDNTNHWLNLPRVFASPENEANKFALDHLQNGADGVFFIVTSQTDPEKLLDQIEWEHCHLLFKSSATDFYSKTLPDFIRKKNPDTNRIEGALFWETLPKKEEVKFYLENTSKVKSLGVVLSSQPAVVSIADTLTSAVNLIEDLQNHYSVDKIISSIAFSVPIDTKFLDSIVKLRALRLLWYQVVRAYGVENYDPSHLRIHAHAGEWINQKYEPHGNMIKATTAAMSSILGGCSALTVEEQDTKNGMMRRIARNVSSILKDESHFNKVNNPLAGTYTIDVMVNEVAKKAWEQFQSNMK